MVTSRSHPWVHDRRSLRSLVRDTCAMWARGPRISPTQRSEYRAVMDTFVHCENLVREADKDRFLAGLFAHAEKRRDLFVLYAFNAEVAGVQGKVREPLAGEVRLQYWPDLVA